MEAGKFPSHSVGTELHAYLSSKLPLSPRRFVKALNSDHFTCDRFGEGIVGGTNERVPEISPITCWYVARGSVGDNACIAGAAVKIRVRFQGPSDITDFDLKEMSFADPSAHGSGLCIPL